jgi:hypothetical protein
MNTELINNKEENYNCTDENRCEECTHCLRTRPCECGCGLLGGTCIPDEDYESANCEICCENYLLYKLEVKDDKFYCRLCFEDEEDN